MTRCSDFHCLSLNPKSALQMATVRLWSMDEEPLFLESVEGPFYFLTFV